MIDITKTNETFTSINGTSVRYSDLFAGILSEVAYMASCGFIAKGQIDDAVHDAVLKALKCAGRYDENRCKSVKYFGCIVARSVILSKVRRESILVKGDDNSTFHIKRQVEWDESAYSGMASFNRSNAAACDAEKDILAAEMLEALDEAMSVLSDMDRIILEKAGDDKKPAEIAKELGLTPNATYSRLCRARRIVKNGYYRQMA